MAGQATSAGSSQAGFRPAVSALTLGLVPRVALGRRLERNAAFDHAGNVAIAAAAGAVGYFVPQRAVFLMVPFFAALAGAAVLSIPAQAIDEDRARGSWPCPKQRQAAPAML